MKYLKKVSLAGKKKLPDDVKVALLNDKVKKHIFMNNIEYESELAGKPLHIKPSSLLNRLWSGIEHLPKTKRQEAITIVKIIITYQNYCGVFKSKNCIYYKIKPQQAEAKLYGTNCNFRVWLFVV